MGAATTELTHGNFWSPQNALEPLLHSKRSHWNEKPKYRNWSRPHLPQLEKNPHSNKDPAQLKINKIFERVEEAAYQI